MIQKYALVVKKNKLSLLVFKIELFIQA